MTKPTPKDKAYQWWREAVAGITAHTKAGLVTFEPQCGYYLRSTARKGDPRRKLIPSSISLASVVDENGDLTEPEVLVCEIGGTIRPVDEEWTWLANYPISRAEYMRLKAEGFAGIELEKPAANGKPSPAAPPPIKTPY